MRIDKSQNLLGLLQLEVNELEEFQLLQSRRYNNPRGYLPYENAAKRSCILILGFRYLHPQSLDYVSRLTIYLIKTAARQHAPAYWLSSELQTAILQSDVPAQVVGMKRVVPCGILFLPTVSGLVSPDGEQLEVIFFSHLLKGEQISSDLSGQIATETIGYDCIQWTAIMPSGIAYAGNVGIDVEEGLKTGGRDYNGIETKSNIASEDQFIDAVGSLVLQVLLLLQVRPELVEEETVLGFGTRQKSANKSSGNQQSLLRPRWIGKSYQVQRVTKFHINTHTSPRMHWRRGHFRRVLIGSRSQNQKKWVWIEPTLVNVP